MNYLVAILVSIAASIFWIGNLVGLPGNWGLVLMAAALAYLVTSEIHTDIHSPAMLSLLVLAIVGEAVEFFAGAAGVKQLGGSKKGGILAVCGSVIGAVVGMVIGVPIPIIGSLIAAVLFGCLGAFGGAVAGERWSGKDWNLSIRIGWGALCGKLLGTALKAICGTVMLVLLLIAVWF